jgi:hypothetical protein
MKFLSDIEVEEGLKDSGGDLGTAGQVLSSTGTGTNWIDAAGTIGGSITDNQIAVGATTANTIEGATDFTYIDGRISLGDSNGVPSMYIGSNAGTNATTGGANVGVGRNSMELLETAYSNSAFGANSLSDAVSTAVSQNTAIGQDTLGNMTAGTNNVALGDQAGYFHGSASTALSTSYKSVYLGTDTRPAANNETNQIVIGYEAVGGGSNTITLGDDNIDLLRIPGLNATSGQVLAYNNTTGGFEAATPSSGSIGGSIADNQIAVGASTANSIEGSSDFTYTGSVFTVEGRMVLSDDLTITSPNSFIGKDSGLNAVATSAINNIGVGNDSLKALTTADYNTAIGAGAMRDTVTNRLNVAIGAFALGQLNGSGSDESSNTAIGYLAGYYYGSGTDNLTDSKNSIYIGETTRPLANNAENEIVIGRGAIGGGSNTITLGNGDIDTFRIPGLGSTNGHVLTYSTTDGGFILAAGGGGGGGIGGATVTNQVAFGAASSTTDITSNSTFTFVKSGTGSSAQTLLEVGDGDSSDNTSFGSVHITAKQVNDSTSRARFQLYSENNLRGYLQCSGTSSDVTLLSNANLVLSGDANVTIEPGSTNDIVMASSSGSGVGIGTTTPSKKLTVNGTIYSEQASGEVMIAGNSAFSTKYITIREGSNYAARWGLQATNDIVTSGVMLMSSSKPMAFRSSTNIAFDSVSLSHLIIRASSTNGAANVGIGTDDPQSKLQVDGGIQMGTDTAADNIAAKAGTLRYREVLNIGTPKASNSYIDMYMRTGDSSYEWVNIVTSNW